MNIKKSLIAATLLMSVSVFTFAQTPAAPAKPAKKAKTEKAATDTSKAVKKAHHTPKKAA
jgi:thiamine pyrophosphokinase